jgi:hypothetical protein
MEHGTAPRGQLRRNVTGIMWHYCRVGVVTDLDV